MTITAKYPSRCACCHQPIEVGSKIEWSKGSPARHAACAGGTVSAPASAARRSSYRPGTTYERGVGRTCDECGDRATPGTRCWETGCMH